MHMMILVRFSNTHIPLFRVVLWKPVETRIWWSCPIKQLNHNRDEDRWLQCQNHGRNPVCAWNMRSARLLGRACSSVFDITPPGSSPIAKYGCRSYIREELLSIRRVICLIVAFSPVTVYNGVVPLAILLKPLLWHPLNTSSRKPVLRVSSASERSLLNFPGNCTLQPHVPSGRSANGMRLATMDGHFSKRRRHTTVVDFTQPRPDRQRIFYFRTPVVVYDIRKDGFSGWKSL